MERLNALVDDLLNSHLPDDGASALHKKYVNLAQLALLSQN